MADHTENAVVAAMALRAMPKKTLCAPLASLRCDVDATVLRAADYPPGPVVCPACGRWLAVVVAH